jgi:hypothetical protein
MAQDIRVSGNNRESVDKNSKKPYHKPEFRHERVFETSALACGKIQTGPSCATNKKSS